MTIKSFGDKGSEQVFHTGVDPRCPIDVAEKARQRMWRLASTSRLDFLAEPAGMRLRKASAFGAGYFQVHVKGRWWVVFRWAHPDCYGVRLVEKVRPLSKRKRRLRKR